MEGLDISMARVICSKMQYRGQWHDAHVFVLLIYAKAHWNAINLMKCIAILKLKCEKIWYFLGDIKLKKKCQGDINYPDIIMEKDSLNAWKSWKENLLKHSLARSFIIISKNLITSLLI